MTRKERVKRAITHEQPDIVPYQIGFTIPFLFTPVVMWMSCLRN